MSDHVQPGTLPSVAPAWAMRARAFVNFFVFDFPGGPKALKASWVINFQKGGTFPLYLFMLWYYENSTFAAWIYAAMHGTYGVVWLIKANAFPDPSWEVKVTFGGAVNMFIAVLGWYWVMGWLLISANATPAYPMPVNVWFCLCVSLCIMGCAIMISADAQKYFTLRVKQGLITDGMFRYIRHPNYLGEIMIYGSFAMMIWQWLPLIILACIWFGLFAANMVIKEASMSRYPDWAEYRSRTWWLVPGVL